MRWPWKRQEKLPAGIPAPEPVQVPRKSLSERRLEERALREGWLLPREKREEIALRLCDVIDPTTEEGSKAQLRHVIQAARTLVSADLRQQSIDLARQKLEGKQSEGSLSDLVAEAEKRANERMGQRDDGAPD